MFFFFFSSRRRHTRSDRDWSSDVCSSDLRLLDNSVQLLWGKQGERLMKACPAFTTGGVWGHGRCRVQRRDRLLNWHDGEWFDERTSQRAYRIVIGDALARVAPSSA